MTTISPDQQEEDRPQIGDARVRYWPDLTFWYSLSFSELAGMPRNIRQVYEQALPRLRAQLKGMMIDAASVPHMEKGDQQRMFESLNRDLRHGTPEPEATAPPSLTEAQRAAAATGVGIRTVPKRESKGARRAREAREAMTDATP